MSQAKRSRSGDVEASRMQEALAKVQKELDALTQHELIVINIDLPSALATALGVLPALRALRPRIEAEAPGTDAKLLDKLETYALALMHAHALYLTATRPNEPMPELVASATALRDTLHADALALVQRGLLASEQLRRVKKGPGHRPLALDLMSLSAIMRSAWAEISGRTAVTPDELDGANELAARLLAAVGERELSAGGASAASDLRQRAFTRFVRAYDELRRAVTFLRWREDDADEIVPSLYAGRSSAARRKDADEAPAGPPDAESEAGAEEAEAPATEEEMPDSNPFVAA